jgi:hypothetical protein
MLQTDQPSTRVRVPRPRSLAFAGALLMTATSLLAGSGPVLGQDASPTAGPDTPVTSDGGGIPEPETDGAIVAEPDPTIVDPSERPWEQIVVGPDGRTLTIYFWNGVEECYGLARVDVGRKDGVLDITLWTGHRPEAVARVCIELAHLYKTVVVLDEPIVTGGTS